MKQIKTNMRSRSLRVVTICLAACQLFSQTAFADHNKEDKVKAAIIFNLARFSDWPAGETQPPKETQPPGETQPQGVQTAPASDFTICVIKSDVREALGDLEGKPIHGSTLAVKTLGSSDDITSLCKIVFLSELEANNTDLVKIAKLGVLTIGDSKKFLDQNGGISIRRIGTKLGFSINRNAMDLAQVRPSSKILRLSMKVR